MKQDPLLWAGVCISAYLIGSLPFGLWIASLRGVDLRKVGSGNIGATNVWRTCGPLLGLPVFLLDVAKAYGPGVAGGWLLSENGFSPEAAILVGISAILGHTFSPLLRFKGGKGVASALGAVLAATPLAGGIAFGVWAVVFVVTRYVSLASIVGVIAAPIAAAALGAPPLVWIIYSLAAVLLIVKHRSNIDRLMKGTEYKFGGKRPQEPDDPTGHEPALAEPRTADPE